MYDTVVRISMKTWTFTGKQRPSFAIPPEPGQESVWDYPRPPAIVADAREVVVSLDGHQLASSSNCIRILETAGPPTFYLPTDDVDHACFEAAPEQSRCEWKGMAHYLRLNLPQVPRVAVGWYYPRPHTDFSEIKNFISFYPGRLECTVAGERVVTQPGGFYGGWITSEIIGPIKGDPGTESW
jgi:uncharacterized protein (DUF427 family)